MGQLIYDAQTLEIRIEDRALAHLQIVIVNMLRRDQKFTFSWKDDVTVGDGRSSIWLHPACNLHFKFTGSRPPSINRAWLAELYAAANSGTGLVLTPEPKDTSTDTDSDFADVQIPGHANMGSPERIH